MDTTRPTPEELARRMKLAREALESLPKDKNGIPILDLSPIARRVAANKAASRRTGGERPRGWDR